MKLRISPNAFSSLSSPGTVGLIMGFAAAICYGFIPTFTLPLRPDAAAGHTGLSDLSILFYRFMSASVIIALLMIVKGKSFRITRGELVTLTYLAFLSDGAALFLLAGYEFMPSGVATTIHFMYPVATAILMMAFYHESRRLSTILAVCMAVLGVGALSWPTGGIEVNPRGVGLELISAICFALYLIRLNRSRVAQMDDMKLTFYVVFIGALIFGCEAFRQEDFQLISTTSEAVNLFVLGLVCTVVTNLCLVVAVKKIGSTMAAVLGALEPLTAVILGAWLWHEVITWNIVLGMCMIIPAVILVIFTRGR